MSDWQFVLTQEAELDLERLDLLTRKRILEKIKWLKNNFEQITPLPLGGKWRGFLNYELETGGLFTKWRFRRN